MHRKFGVQEHEPDALHPREGIESQLIQVRDIQGQDVRGDAACRAGGKPSRGFHSGGTNEEEKWRAWF